MKRLVSILIVLFAVVALHAEEQPITFGELPKNAKIFVFTYFKDIPFTEVYIERRASLTQYEVRLQDGVELQFDRTGLCTEISSKNGEVPDIVIPKRMLSVIRKHYPDNYIRKYENNGRMYEIELDNGVVLTFSMTMRLIDVDE
ncbi:MAG: PepSY-like domain-containing protein [Bacteroidaceae bacterium]|nr:PepSY-like domain-containing protein [Bacteroidaceae bacterium]